mmetsp:Transcript_31731/g.86808  ORF Transcript_31731/g.86808 Transcript_31731/m.86808 type:complete len:257 (-) Transcript_31731:109-879(-)
MLIICSVCTHAPAMVPSFMGTSSRISAAPSTGGNGCTMVHSVAAPPLPTFQKVARSQLSSCTISCTTTVNSCARSSTALALPARLVTVMIAWARFSAIRASMRRSRYSSLRFEATIAVQMGTARYSRNWQSLSQKPWHLSDWTSNPRSCHKRVRSCRTPTSRGVVPISTSGAVITERGILPPPSIWRSKPSGFFLGSLVTCVANLPVSARFATIGAIPLAMSTLRFGATLAITFLSSCALAITSSSATAFSRSSAT